MTEFAALSASAAGMEAERMALDVDARNVAAAETGDAFERLVPRFVVAAQDSDDGEPFVRFAGTTTQQGEGVDAITEMVAVLNAERAFEADAAVFESGKRLAERTIDVGRS